MGVIFLQRMVLYVDSIVYDQKVINIFVRLSMTRGIHDSVHVLIGILNRISYIMFVQINFIMQIKNTNKF